MADALHAYLAALVGREPASSLLEIRSRRVSAPGMDQMFVPVRELDRAARAILNRGEFSDTCVGVAPRTCPEGNAGAVARVWVLWADIDTEEGLDRLRAFRPLPSIVVRSGSGGAHAYWPLEAPLSPEHAQRANRRIALRTRGDMQATDAARILRPPGTANFKHTPPRPVVCARLEPIRFTASQVVGGLRDSDHYTRPPRRLRRPLGHSAPRPERVLDGLVRAIARARPGGRNASLFWATCRAVEHADAAKLDERHALDQLSMAALEAGLDGDEIRATIGSAQRTARQAA